MKTGFIETSAINYLFNKKINGYQASNIFKNNNLIPIVGVDTIYELAHCFLVNTDKAQELFNFINQLQPVYSCKRDMLYRRELDNLLNDTPLDPLLGYFSREELEKRVKNYLEGNIDETHKDFRLYRRICG